MNNVDLVRRYVLRKVNDLRIYISMLSPLELEALKRLQGPDGVKTATRIADYVLQELGHEPPQIDEAGNSPTVKAARKVMPGKT